MRPIDADEMKSIKSIQSANFNSIESIREWIDAQPTADVRENVRGEWLHKKTTDDYHVTGQCSNCHERKRIDNFCPNCGADMRGERKYESVDEDDIQPHVCSTCHWCLNDWHQEPCNICVYGSKWKDGR